MKKLYRIGVFEEQAGYFKIMAESPAQAKRIISDRVNENGIDETAQEYEFDPTHRDVRIIK